MQYENFNPLVVEQTRANWRIKFIEQGFGDFRSISVSPLQVIFAESFIIGN